MLKTIFKFKESFTFRASEIVIQTTVALPLALTKKLSGLRYATLCGVGIIFYILIAVVIEAPFFILHPNWKSEDIKYFNGDWKDYLSAFGITVFAYQSHTNIFCIRDELQRPYAYRFNKIQNITILIEFLLYLLMSIFGYLSNPSKISELVIQRKTLDNTIDYPMLIAQFGILFSLLIAIPVNLYPTRILYYEIRNINNPTNKQNYIFTIIIMYLTSVVAIIFPNIYAALGILGGFCGTTITITFPGLLYLYTSEKSRGIRRLTLFILIIILTAIGFLSTFVTLEDSLNN